MKADVALTSNLKVLVVSHRLDVATGGAERYIAEVCQRLQNFYKLQLTYLSTDALTDHVLSPARYRFMTTSFHPAWFTEIKAWIAALRPDVIYVHHTVPGVTDLALKASQQLNIPSVLMYHSDVTGPGLAKQSLGRTYHALWGRTVLQIPKVIFVPTLEYVKSSVYLRQLSASYVEAPPGVDPVMLTGRRESRAPFLLFVGKHELASKGFSLLKRAWSRLRTDWPQLELVVAGGLAKGSQAGEPRYLGQITSRQRLADLYASAAVTVLPSMSSAESFGMVLAESLLAGSPIVGSDIGGISWLIENGINGYLVPPGDVHALTRALDTVLNEQAQLRSSIQARRKAYAERFSWAATTDAVAHTLTSIAARMPAGSGA